MWGREQSFHALPRHTTLPALLHVHHPDHVWLSIEASSHKHDWLLTPFSMLIFSQENRGGSEAENYKFPIIAWSFRWQDLTQEPSRSPLRVTSLEQKTVLLLKKLEGFQELCVRNQGQRPNIGTNKKMFLVFLCLGICKGFRISVPGSRGRFEYMYIQYSIYTLYIYIYISY